MFRLPFADGRHAPIAAVDQARVIAAILRNPTPHDRQIYPLYGPVELDHDGIAAKIATCSASLCDMNPSTSRRSPTCSPQRDPTHFIQHITNVAQDYRDGIFAGTNNLVEVIGNRTPMTVADYVNANREAFARMGASPLHRSRPMPWTSDPTRFHTATAL